MPLSLDGKSIFVDTSKIDPIKPVVEWEREVEWRYQENIGKCEAAYMIGSGYVGLALADMLNYFDAIRPFQISESRSFPSAKTSRRIIKPSAPILTWASTFRQAAFTLVI